MFRLSFLVGALLAAPSTESFEFAFALDRHSERREESLVVLSFEFVFEFALALRRHPRDDATIRAHCVRGGRGAGFVVVDEARCAAAPRRSKIAAALRRSKNVRCHEGSPAGRFENGIRISTE